MRKVPPCGGNGQIILHYKRYEDNILSAKHQLIEVVSIIIGIISQKANKNPHAWLIVYYKEYFIFSSILK